MITLSIEGESLRLLSFSGKKITGWESIPLLPHQVRGGYVSDPDGVGNVIRETLVERHLTKKPSVFSFPSLGSACDTISLPKKLKKAQRDDVVSREARRSMAFSPEASYIYWQLLPHDKFEEQKAWVITVPKEPLQRLLKTSQAAGVKLRAVELVPLALSRLLPGSDGIVAHCETNRVEMVIVVGSVPVLIRSAFIGESDDYANDYSDPEDQILRQIQYTISFYNEAHREFPLDPTIPIYLSGSMALDLELAERVVAITERPVAPLELAFDCPADFPLPLYAVNLGLMLRN